MKQQDVMEILVFLMEHYASSGDKTLSMDWLAHEQAQISQELQQAGFKPEVIVSAFDWLSDLVAPQSEWDTTLRSPSLTAVRVFCAEESEKLSFASRRFLLFLTQMGVLNAELRELVIDQAMALQHEEIHVEQLKWVALMVLLNQPGQEAAVAWLQDVENHEQKVVVH